MVSVLASDLLQFYDGGNILLKTFRPKNALKTLQALI
jgi:hypothetical protein